MSQECSLASRLVTVLCALSRCLERFSLPLNLLDGMNSRTLEPIYKWQLSGPLAEPAF